MPLGSFRAERFRCLASVELQLDPAVNLFIGPNASGKTSLLEAAFFLSRGQFDLVVGSQTGSHLRGIEEAVPRRHRASSVH